MKYFQYIEEFQELCERSGYTDLSLFIAEFLGDPIKFHLNFADDVKISNAYKRITHYRSSIIKYMVHNNKYRELIHSKNLSFLNDKRELELLKYFYKVDCKNICKILKFNTYRLIYLDDYSTYVIEPLTGFIKHYENFEKALIKGFFKKYPENKLQKFLTDLK